ncbi:WD40 repeat domain-containing protein [bacterium]|nr:WD40 repeat domain-containing protein [bacterium]
MLVLDAGARVTQLRFLPDGRLLVGTWAAGDAEVAIWSLPSGPRVVIPLSVRQVWDEPSRVAVAPAGDRMYLTFGTLQTHSTTDGSVILGGPLAPAGEVIVSPDGRRLVSAYRETNGDTVLYGHEAWGGRVWQATYPHPRAMYLAGFLPDGDRFLVAGYHAVAVRSFDAQQEFAAVPYPAHRLSHLQLSPDGRHLGVIGHHSFYVYDTAALGKPRRISGSSNSGNFVGFAFHPAGKTLAVIYGGPTLVKLYDLDTLTLRTKLNWKVGPLTCVAFSADGLLAAAGTDDGRVVVWDVDG